MKEVRYRYLIYQKKKLYLGLLRKIIYYLVVSVILV